LVAQVKSCGETQFQIKSSMINNPVKPLPIVKLTSRQTDTDINWRLVLKKWPHHLQIRSDVPIKLVFF